MEIGWLLSSKAPSMGLTMVTVGGLASTVIDTGSDMPTAKRSSVTST